MASDKPTVHITWIDNSAYYATFMEFAAKECVPYPVPQHEPMVLLRAEIAELPGLSVWTTEPYIVRTWKDNPFGAWMNAGSREPAPPRPAPEIVARHEVRIRTTHSDERHPFNTREELEEIVRRRAEEILAECIAERHARLALGGLADPNVRQGEEE